MKLKVGTKETRGCVDTENNVSGMQLLKNKSKTYYFFILNYNFLWYDIVWYIYTIKTVKLAILHLMTLGVKKGGKFKLSFLIFDVKSDKTGKNDSKT